MRDRGRDRKTGRDRRVQRQKYRERETEGKGEILFSQQIGGF